VVVARDYKFMCSSLGQELIQKDIAEEGLTRVVVAACSPHLHEQDLPHRLRPGRPQPLPLRAGQHPRAGLLGAHRQSGGHEKAKAVVSGGVERVIHNEPLEPLRVPINDATLVVGGGIAGIQAALEIADAGFKVYLVEREPSIGGHMAQFDKTFPTLDCSACILTPKMVEVGNHPNVSCSPGAKWSGRRLRRQLHRHHQEEAALRRHRPLHRLRHLLGEVPAQGDRRHLRGRPGLPQGVYTPFPQAVPKYPVIDPNCTYFERGKCKACQILCPTGAID
jgi:heterodisulfide reductase subunit A2